MKTVINQGEVVIKKGAANLQRNIETVGGKLYLTNQRLIFEANKFNVQTDVVEIKLPIIISIKKSWTRFLGIFPTVPNSISVFTDQGKEFRFVLFGRSKWIVEIEAQQNA